MIGAVTDTLLSAVLLKCCTAMGYWCDIKSAAESRNKWSRFQGRSTTIVDV
jgi:hypothetical protein